MADQTDRGRRAEQPTDIPKAGWLDIGKRTMAEVKNDHVPLLSAGVAFYAMLALFPALIGLITVYGLVADPAQVEEQITSFTSGMGSAGSLIQDQLSSIVQGSSSALSWGLAASLAGVLWSASSGMQNLIKATNVVYDETETRKFFKLRGLALLLTIGAILFMVIAIGLVAVLPAVLGNLGLGVVGRIATQVARWVLLALVVVIALAVIYRLAPDRDDPRWNWVSAGAIVATVLWLIGSALFSFYINNFGSYNETYGTLAGVIVLMLWLFLTSFIVLFGAEINSEMELQTVKDTTKGEEQPLGRRDAVKADETPDTSDAGASKPG